MEFILASNNDNENRLDKKKKKALKQLEKDKEKLQKHNERLLKRAAKPGECLKYIISKVDSRVLEISEGCEILSKLLSMDLKYEVNSFIPYTISFAREDCLTKQVSDEKELITIIPIDKALSLIHNQTHQPHSPETLKNYCLRLLSSKPRARLTLVIGGLDEYFSKNKPSKRKRKKMPASQTSADQFEVSRVDVETALVTIQVDLNITTRLISSPAEIADFIAQMVKAVAEAPYKLDKSGSEFSWYAEGSNTNCVKVETGGEGLARLWQRQLEQFINVGSETARAITNHYSTPRSLMKAYECLNEREGAALLADIQVRRGVGVLASTRRVGLELSRRIYTFLTELNPEVVL